MRAPAASRYQWLILGLCLTILPEMLEAQRVSVGDYEPIIPGNAITPDSGDVVKKLAEQSLDDSSAPAVSKKSLPEIRRLILANQAQHLLLVLDKPELQPLLPQGPPA